MREPARQPAAPLERRAGEVEAVVPGGGDHGDVSVVRVGDGARRTALMIVRCAASAVQNEVVPAESALSTE